MKIISLFTQILNFNRENIRHFDHILRQIDLPDILRDCSTIENDETGKTDGTKTIFHNRITLILNDKKQNKNINVQGT